MSARGFWLLLAMLTATLLGAAHAQRSVTMYRCTDAAGVTTFQNGVPCPKGMQQEKRLLDTTYAAPTPAMAMPAPAAAPTPTAPAPTPTTVQSTAHDNVLAIEARLPPPPIFECRTYDDKTYLSETFETPERCVPLQTVGIDGGSGIAAGAACEMKVDQCQRVPDQDACDAWRKRVRETLSAWKFGAAGDGADARQSAYERALKVTSETTCGQP